MAFDILRRVADGAYASDLLHAHTAALDSRDAALASEIVLGCLRRQLQLDYVIATLVRAPKLDIEVRIALRMGIYQIRELERVPAYAAVTDSVELVKRARKRSAAALVNAALRRVKREPVEWPDRATRLSCPQWLLERWSAAYSEAEAGAIALAFLEPPEKTIASTGRMQDAGSQMIVPLLDLHTGDRFLDLCAAPGNKTAQAVQHGVHAVACDLHLHRLRHVPAGPSCARVVLDGTASLPFRGVFDRILVDAPCSGTGTLGRNPEIKWRLLPADLTELQNRQRTLLANALAHLAPGGRLVYSTCSLEREENEDVVATFPREWKLWSRLPGRDAGDGFFAAFTALVNSRDCQGAGTSRGATRCRRRISTLTLIRNHPRKVSFDYADKAVTFTLLLDGTRLLSA